MGQEELILKLIIALLADGHVLVEGVPGLAKTRAIKALSQLIQSSFHRVQFTPDLLPADLTGTEIYRIENGLFEFQPGPLFHNIILADEINRAPAKVQSALLEAMAERQITVGKQTYPLPELFMVMATQNPLEQEGTYPLPEAQLDRFLMKLEITYPSAENELQILNLVLKEELETLSELPAVTPSLTQPELKSARKEVNQIFLSDNLKHYIVQIVTATRNPEIYGSDFKRWITFGVSPRGTISLAKCAKALAFLEGQNFVTPVHIQKLVLDLLRHRIGLSYEAEAEGITADICLQKLLAQIAVP